MTPAHGKKRVVRETLFVVCEGDAEVAFVRFVKRTYADSLGRGVQEHNAKGKGGKNVLETALRHARSNRDYDKVVLLLDTDTDWNDALRAKALSTKVGKRPLSVIEGHPCVEAWLLEVLRVETEGDSRHMKKVFKEYTGHEAHEVEWLGKHIDRRVLDEARERVRQLAELLNHMGISKA